MIWRARKSKSTRCLQDIGNGSVHIHISLSTGSLKKTAGLSHTMALRFRSMALDPAPDGKPKKLPTFPSKEPVAWEKCIQDINPPTTMTAWAKKLHVVTAPELILGPRVRKGMRPSRAIQVFRFVTSFFYRVHPPKSNSTMCYGCWWVIVTWLLLHPRKSAAKIF